MLTKALQQWVWWKQARSFTFVDIYGWWGPSTHYPGWNWKNNCCLNHKGVWRYLEDEYVWQMTRIYLSASCVCVCAISSLTEMQSEFTFTHRDEALTHAYQSLIQWNNNETWRYATGERPTLLHTHSLIHTPKKYAVPKLTDAWHLSLHLKMTFRIYAVWRQLHICPRYFVKKCHKEMFNSRTTLLM